MTDGSLAEKWGGGPPPDPPPGKDPLLGRVIADRFTITRLLAKGGMGKVYLAEQAPLGRLCALKVLNPSYTGEGDPEFHRRFFREASITSRIAHPNSVTIFDYGRTTDDVYYMAMEYLEGQTLHQSLRENGPMVEDRVGKIASQICRALREAHRLDVIHRDLKPANVFLTRHGDEGDFVKILDFGLVKHLSERPEEQLTQTGLFMGSPKYMAPEQIQGGVVDARTDVYSLGIMMYEMLTGKVPFERPSSVGILMAHVGEPPPAMRSVNPYMVCSPAFEEIVMRCIAKDPNVRFSSMDEVLLAIKRTQGVTFTGQLAAVSGSYAQFSSAPPPVVTSQPPGAVYASAPPGGHASASRSGPALMLSSGAHTPVGVGGTIDTASVQAQLRPRSRASIFVGVLAAAVLGGGLGMLAFRVTQPEGAEAETVAPTPPARPAPAARAEASAVPAPAPSPAVPPAPSPAVSPAASSAVSPAVAPAASSAVSPASVPASALAPATASAPASKPPKPRAPQPSAEPPADAPPPSGFKDTPY